MKFDEIDKVAKLMQDYELSEFCLESEDMKLKMKRGSDVVAVATAPMAAPAAAMAAAAPAAPAAAEAGTAAEGKGSDISGPTIDSPIVGTFYSAPAPDAPAFVKAGDQVDPETVVCIVEAMKVMNEIKAEKSGVIKRVLVENAAPVEYGQPMFELEIA
jgi:acetyl-CoA carboxylase biotin carboxyl carrier protein